MKPRMHSAAVLLLIGACGACCSECVLLLHGLGRSGVSMRPIERRLKKEGFSAHTISYPSTRYPIETVCSLFVEPAIDKYTREFDSVSFVTHSMGGIIVRYVLTKNNLNCKSVVMLCPPSGGSALSDSLKKTFGWMYRLANGPAGQQLGNDSLSILPKLGKLRCRIGVIAGDKSWEPYLSCMIPGSDDGKVAVNETVLPEMTDFIVLNHTHTFMMNNRDTQDQVVRFLKKGRFDYVR